MKFVFIIQGEGRGHLSQAARLKDILESRGHTVEAAYMGMSPQRPVSGYARELFGDKLNYFRSPNFIRKSNRKGILLGKSLSNNIIHFIPYLRSLVFLIREIRNKKPEAVINFYDLLGGLAFYFSKSDASFYAVSHHFLFEHPAFPHPPEFKFQKRLLVWHNRLTSLKAAKRLALSFDKQENFNSTLVMPPLIRKELRDVEPGREDFVLVYLLNEGLSIDLLPLFHENSKLEFRLYMQEGINPGIFPANVQLFPPGDDFARQLPKCRAVICSSGFETLCEAAFLNKAVFLIPSENHYEQYGNLLDALRAGIAQEHLTFEEDQLFRPDRKNFRDWCEKAEKMFAEALEA